MPTLDPEITRGGVVRSQIVRDQILRQKAIFLQRLAHQFQRCGLIPLGLDQDIQNLPFAIDGAPQLNQAPINPRIDLVKMPRGVWFRSAFAKIGGDFRPEAVNPATHGFIRSCDPAFRQQIFDVAEAQTQSDI